ncbi:hypothetical protein SK128_021366, partial [Halocaridina rubra]
MEVKVRHQTRRDSEMSTGSGHMKNGVYRSTPEKKVDKEKIDDQPEGQLITEEKLEKGDIPFSTYHLYIKAAGGYILSTLVILTFVLNVGSTAFSSWWLSYWLSSGSG